MSNVLPQTTRASVWRMYRARAVIAASLVLCAVAALSGLALLPSYMALHAAEEIPSQQRASGTSQQDRDAIIRTQAMLNAVSPLLSATTTAELVASAIALRPASIRIDHITATAGNPGTIILTGVAQSPEAISEYQKVLRSSPNFSGVSVPVSDLAGTGNGQFSVTLSAIF